MRNALIWQQAGSIVTILHLPLTFRDGVHVALVYHLKMSRLTRERERVSKLIHRYSTVKLFCLYDPSTPTECNDSASEMCKNKQKVYKQKRDHTRFKLKLKQLKPSLIMSN